MSPSDSASSSLSSLITSLVLRHSPTTTKPQSLALALSHLSPPPPWPPSILSSVFKRLWNHGPLALLFFHSLLHLPHPNPPPPPSTFDLAIDVAARLRDRPALLSLLSLRRRLAVPSSPRTSAILMERYANSGKPDRAVRVFLSMGPDQDLSAFNTLLDVLCKSRRVEKATSIFKALRSRLPPDAVTYNVIADGWCRLKKTSKALEVFKEMVESGIEPTMNTYNIILKGFFRAGQVKQAWEFFTEMKKRGKKEGICRPDVVSYTTVVHGLGLDGQLDKARKVFDEMVGQGCLPSVATYNALIQVICKKGKVQDAVLMFEEMVGKGYTPNVVTYTVLIRGLCHAGKMARAMELFDTMTHEGCEPSVQTYNVVIRYWCEEGEIETGLEMFARMGERGDCLPNLDTYNVIISAMFVRKRPEDMVVAGKMVMEMVERGYLPRRFVFNRVLNGLLLTGNQEFARELLRLQDRFGRLRREIKL
ncbi:pentatricopeptide repeat-containing protein At1g74900, mitochondrial [Typha angustifolia]|uniref:pentatricopeptide repeat-containing protein At1g74900, mitochondrial n=1 Tax=Typha angustifolia TaxID=59011 RepID=UPI003C2EC13C